MEVKDDSGMTMTRRAEIDTRPPFRSVKEAVSWFGDGVLAPDVHTRKLKPMNSTGSDLDTMTAEIEETKQSLEKVREETELITTQMSSLKQELDITRRELRELKHLRESQKPSAMKPTDLREIEDLKFIKDSPKPISDSPNSPRDDEHEEQEVEFQKKRYVTFAHPTLSQIILPEGTPSLERNASMKKKKNKNKKKAFTIPFIGGIFTMRKPKCEM